MSLFGRGLPSGEKGIRKSLDSNSHQPLLPAMASDVGGLNVTLSEGPRGLKKGAKALTQTGINERLYLYIPLLSLSLWLLGEAGRRLPWPSHCSMQRLRVTLQFLNMCMQENESFCVCWWGVDSLNPPRATKCKSSSAFPS
ncbi:Hypothetical predicted protein [Podarcis lilfordi]|uniref:Uncharacterized protein n=1 Tax=Podarcis lilfordi TaxID=74358 RepID=A0AA35LFL8_9SAUR|nr:Hypothetical predicted protein [Podarcis lilfordi]